jgi:hypothetical protein
MNKYLIDKLNSLNSDQLKLFNDIQKNKLLQICIPTGAGKGYLMMIDILNRILNSQETIFAISSHRLMLNTQHLNDLFEMLSPFVGNIGFVFVGSSKYDTSKFQNNPFLNKSLLKSKLSYDEIISSTTNTKEVDELVKSHLDNNRKVVILTTYHSLHTLKNQSVDTIYCDEAHTLASDEDSAKFRVNFESITASNKYFLTATPKDCFEDTEAFLMNNKEVFGERVGLTFKECIDKGYMVKPVLHIAMPGNYDNSLEFKSVKNMTKFVTDTFKAHNKWLKEVSFDGSRIAPKILVKCPSVDDMWKIWNELNGKFEGVRICAGASRNDMSSFNHFIDSEGIAGRSEYLEKIQNFDESEMAIVLHYDTMSEGINVSGFTGVMFLGGKLPTIIKTLQNTGRATRLHLFDRDRLGKGEIMVGDGKWIKPNCAVIIPFWDSESDFTKEELSKQIKGLRDNFGYDPVYYVSIGSDIGSGKKKDDMEGLNKKDEKNKKSELIEEIQHYIERFDKEESDLKEIERINSMSMEEWFNYANNITT